MALAPKLAVLAVLLTMSWGTARAGDGAVYMMTNAAEGNQLAVFARDAKACSNSPSSTTRAVLARAAGSAARGRSRWTPPATPSTWSTPASGSISVFDLSKKEPDLIQIISSGGTFPNSVAVSGNFLYVLNAGGAHGAVDIITGFTVDAKGKLTALANSTRSLSGPAVLPAQVSFSPNGNWLVVTERNGNNIDVFKVLADGRTSAPTFTPSPVTDTFGFLFSSNGLSRDDPS